MRKDRENINETFAENNKADVQGAEYHTPVLLTKSIDGLNIHRGGIYVDVTFGGGGHSKEILSRFKGGEHLYSFDQDADAENNAGDIDSEQFTFVRSNFRYLKNWMRYHGVDAIDGLIADLGVSSHHFDDETRGFSFRFDSPLDMRMNKRAGKTAAEILNNASEEELADIFYIYGEMKNSRRIAAAIVKSRGQKNIESTHDLLSAVEPMFRKEREKKDMARLFQALRIEVNHEMDALRDMLKNATELLVPGGRLSIITYHSLEDRIVKNVMKTGNAEGKMTQDFFGRINTPFALINNKVITPQADEIERNPRSRSAKLRIAEKI
ncbi:16S rRNA (cytosine(1402)-N(4))-methyltransferase RsmH [Prevotella sp. OH937_COT-195]|uniref:16S rRNA (cytosine(1402)-N(4))-methyltransferase RsmH n=1 Tax=Prevotella sp. OH937_COT-195 TaxID=2491051 RepID=UPI000F64A8C1|nr:16S rRNA (cytosine(1402)-N(4))-methyltransferase RsmH [Prevotella sp. OH937_COT-195]RRD00796.1 16S rRNA (cytosine(1402)-N(4))-methyltransferase RsmH [Prevotella sp. OH937_COT-195]